MNIYINFAVKNIVLKKTRNLYLLYSLLKKLPDEELSKVEKSCNQIVLILTETLDVCSFNREIRLRIMTVNIKAFEYISFKK